MAASRLVETRNFRQVDTRLLTAGQPNEAQLADAAAQGVEVLINLAMHDDARYSLKDGRNVRVVAQLMSEEADQLCGELLCPLRRHFA